MWISAAFSLDNMLRHDRVGQRGQRDLARLTLQRVFFLSSPLVCSILCFFPSHLISPEALRQDPVVDVDGDTGEGAVHNFRRALLGDAFRDSSTVGAVSEGEELPVHPSEHLRDTNDCLNEMRAEVQT